MNGRRGPTVRRREGHGPTRAHERVRIDGIAAGGDGVGRLADGRVAFVARTAPGDLVEARILVQKRRYVRAEAERLLERSLDRRPAPCPHYARCGGCSIEHLAYPAQLAAKRELVREALRRIGGMEIEVPEVVASPRETKYRNRVSFALRRLGGGRVVAGFHDRLNPDRILDIDGRCLLPEPAVAEGWDTLRRSWGTDASRLPSGERLRLTVRGTHDGALTLLVEGGYGPGRAAELVAAVRPLESVWHRPAGAEAVLLAGAERVEEDWSGERVLLGGTMFLQVNRDTAALLEAHVLERTGSAAGLRLIDAYCGVGIYARRLVRAGAEVLGIELDAHALEEARRACGAGVTLLQARVEDVLAQHLPVDVVIANPPRAGLDAAACAALVTRPPARLVYVSCDPATLARDARRLSPVLRLRAVRSFDMFPQTTHVETVAEFECDTM